MRDADRIRQVGAIIRNDPSIRFVVVSAPQGVTDMLLAVKTSLSKPVHEVWQRFSDISTDLCGIDGGYRPHDDLARIRILAERGLKDELVSRGEYICAKIVADYLGFKFLDAASFVRFDFRGDFDLKATKDSWQKLALSNAYRYVIPGFYGALPDGEIKLFSRNASDFSAAIVANCAHADMLEKWTDESGIRRADPRIVPDAEFIDELTFREIRELTTRGTKILHPEVIFPLREAGIPIHIKNVDRPNDLGTRIVPNEKASPKPPGTVVGISSRKNFTVFGVEKMPMGIGFAAQLLGVFAEMKIDIAHIVDGVDEMGIVIDEEELKGSKHGDLCVRIKEVCRPDMLNIDYGMTIISVVGLWMDNAPGTALRVLEGPARESISIELIDQSKSQTNIVLGVADRDCDETVRAIYNHMIRNRLH